MYKKLLILSMLTVAVSPAFAVLTVNSIDTTLNGYTKSGTDIDGYTSNLNTGNDYQYANSVDGAQAGYADGYVSSVIAGDSVSAYSYAQAASQVVGVGQSASWAITYTKISFTLSSAANVSYNVWADGAGYGSRSNRASVSFGYASGSGGGPLPVAGLGDNLTGSVLLGAGSYIVEMYNKSAVTAKSNSASSSAYSYSYGQSSLSMTAEAVPEPATMAVLGLGAAALLRRRKKA